MKKIALILALSFIVPMAVASSARAASTNSDLAIGDPMSKGYKRPKKRVAKPATSTETAAPKEEAKPAAEKAPAEKPAK